MTDLNRKMAKSAAWMILLRFAERAIGMISTLILARVLVPSDFGLVAMAMSVYAAAEIMTTFSFDIALIQNREAGREHFDTAWTFNIIFGAGIMFLMAIAAYPSAVFYSDERVIAIMLCLGMGALVRGFENIGVIYFQKDLNLRKEFELGLARKLVGFAVTASIAVVYRSYWALVIGTLVQRVFSLGMTFAIHPYRPKLSLARGAELFKFGKWLAVNNLLIFLVHRLPEVFVGRFLGSAPLGTFNVAYEIANLPTTELVYPIGRAVFPGYSALAGNLDALRRGYLRVLGLIFYLTLPIAIGICILAKPLVLVLLGAKWEEAIEMIQILSVFGFIRAITSNCGSVFIALGNTRITAYLTIYYLAIVAPVMWFAIHSHGLQGAGWAILIAAGFQTPISILIAFRMVDARPKDFLQLSWRPILAAAGMTVLILKVVNFIHLLNLGNAYQLISAVVIGALAYITLTYCLWMMARRPNSAEDDVLTLIRSLRTKLGRK